MKHTVTILAALLLAPLAAPHAGDAPEHGARSVTPAKRWEEAFVTGNGRMGAMLFGNATNVTLVANHCRLFLPLGNREIVPNLAQHVPELRQIIREKNYGDAMRFFLGKAKEQGYPGLTWTDKYHPGLFVNIRVPADGAVSDYERTENFATGEVVERWRDQRGEFRRRLFASRTDNLIALEVTGPAPCALEFPAIEHTLVESHAETSAEWNACHNVYAKGKGGFDTAVRIVRKNDGRDTLVLIRIAPWKTPLPKEQSEAWAYAPDNPDFKHAGVFKPAPPLAESSVVAYRTTDEALALLPQLKHSLAAVRADYDTLFAPHAQAHGALFNRAALDLGGGAERALTVEELLDRAQRESRLPGALMEKMFDAGRYMLICSAGELLPNLQGIWTGSWNAPWSGDFTLDTNVQAALAGACSANLADLMEGYFRTMESCYPEWRLNAKRIYGCRGFFTNARASNTALELHWGGWEGVFWTAGCGWLASFFSDYADYTADREFRAKRCVPLLKEIAAFYGDFLSETDQDGRVVFIPSYNPETGCGINATMDIAVTRETLMKLIAACRELNIESDNVPQWEALLSKLPPYPINDAGELCEFPGYKLSAGHRHHSQLYPCYQSFDPLFETDAALRAAAQATVRAKIAASDRAGKGDEQSSFGRVQDGVSAAHLGLAEEAYSRLKVMATKRSMNPSLITSHEPNGGIFNTDGNGGIPQIVCTMLVFSRPDRIDLLPALPAAWPNGSVKGLRARGNVTVNLEWKDGKVSSYRITSPEPREVKVRVNGETKVIRSEKI
jgi:alpha-L-fucosidase 2